MIKHLLFFISLNCSCSSEKYIEVYGNLYYLIGQAEDTSATDKYPGFVLKKEGEEFVEQNANLFKYDLLYNPLRFESWHKLANIYDEVRSTTVVQSLHFDSCEFLIYFVSMIN